MKKILFALVVAAFSLGANAAGDAGIKWDKAPNKVNDLEALQHGAKLFVHYCLGCHSAAYMRYNRLTDIGLTEQQIKDNLLFTTDKVGETMKATLDPKQAKEWFGTNPPDLTLMARAKSDSTKGSGADFLYTYLRSYYRDTTKATGWNNLAFPDVAMPHPLWELQGEREPLYETPLGKKQKEFSGKWKQLTPGSLSAQEYDQAVGDLVAYMQWMAEPVQGQRVRVGVWVMLFLLLMIFLSWRLNAAYWRDIK